MGNTLKSQNLRFKLQFIGTARFFRHLKVLSMPSLKKGNFLHFCTKCFFALSVLPYSTKARIFPSKTSVSPRPVFLYLFIIDLETQKGFFFKASTEERRRTEVTEPTRGRWPRCGRPPPRWASNPRLAFRWASMFAVLPHLRTEVRCSCGRGSTGWRPGRRGTPPWRWRRCGRSTGSSIRPCRRAVVRPSDSHKTFSLSL